MSCRRGGLPEFGPRCQEPNSSISRIYRRLWLADFNDSADCAAFFGGSSFSALAAANRSHHAMATASGAAVV